jgi:hypothetical protein
MYDEDIKNRWSVCNKKIHQTGGCKSRKIFDDVFSDPVTGEKLERPESQNDRNTGRTIKQERLASWNDRKNRV